MEAAATAETQTVPATTIWPAPNGFVPGAVMLDSLTKNKETVKEVIAVVGEQVSHARTAKIRVSHQISWLVFAFLGLIVLSTGALVYTGRMSDGSFTFLLGVIVGYLMHFADKVIFKAEEE